MTSGPLYIDFETFASRAGASRQAYGDAGLHSPGGKTSRRARAAMLASQLKSDGALAAKRAALRLTYDALVTSGAIAPPDRIARLIATAQGHPDRRDVQAARRLCDRYGMDWNGTGTKPEQTQNIDRFGTPVVDTRV